MENKLTLEHLAPYLPYGLKCIITLYQEKGVLNVEQLSKNRVWVSKGGSVHLWQDQYISNIKPIFRPLSDLTKEIDHKGYRIVPIDYISTSTKDSQSTMRRIENEQELDVLDYWKVQRLCEMNFDVFDLIAYGLAVDINTVDNA